MEREMTLAHLANSIRAYRDTLEFTQRIRLRGVNGLNYAEDFEKLAIMLLTSAYLLRRKRATTGLATQEHEMKHLKAGVFMLSTAQCGEYGQSCDLRVEAAEVNGETMTYRWTNKKGGSDNG